MLVMNMLTGPLQFQKKSSFSDQSIKGKHYDYLWVLWITWTVSSISSTECPSLHLYWNKARSATTISTFWGENTPAHHMSTSVSSLGRSARLPCSNAPFNHHLSLLVFLKIRLTTVGMLNLHAIGRRSARRLKQSCLLPPWSRPSAFLASMSD